MNGEKGWSKVEKIIDKELDDIGLSNIRTCDVTKYTNMTQADIHHMSPEECGEAAILLHMESLYVQVVINRLKMKMEWTNKNIDKIISPIIEQVCERYTQANYKRQLAIQNNSVAKEHDRMYNEALAKYNQLEYLPTTLKSLASAFTNYQKVKDNETTGTTEKSG